MWDAQQLSDTEPLCTTYPLEWKSEAWGQSASFWSSVWKSVYKDGSWVYLLSSLSSLFLVSVSIILITLDSYSEALALAFWYILKMFRKIALCKGCEFLLHPCCVLGTLVGLCTCILILRATLRSVIIPILLIRRLSLRKISMSRKWLSWIFNTIFSHARVYIPCIFFCPVCMTVQEGITSSTFFFIFLVLLWREYLIWNLPS